jgi:membrane fusion protein (multidrug efflux system)
MKAMTRNTSLAALAWGTLAVWMAGSPGIANAQAPVVVEGSKAVLGQPTQIIRTAGEVAPIRSIMVRNSIAGVVAHIAFADGGSVNKDDALITFDDSRYKTIVDESAARLKLSQENYNRAIEIGKRGFGKESDVDRTLAEMQEAQATLERARFDLKLTTIRAPFKGNLGIRRVHEGQYLAIGADIVNLEDMSSALIHFRLPQRYLGEVKVGDPFTIQTGTSRYAAKISAIDPALAEESRTIRVQGAVENGDGKLRAGQFVTVMMDLVAGPKQVYVPAAAVVYNGDNRFVVKVVKGASQPTKVTTGALFNGMIGINSGVAADDEVVVAGQEKVFRPGVPVKVLAPSFPTNPTQDAQIVPSQGR